jgi:hypothetical protein
MGGALCGELPKGGLWSVGWRGEGKSQCEVCERGGCGRVECCKLSFVFLPSTDWKGNGNGAPRVYVYFKKDLAYATHRKMPLKRQ